MSLSSAAFVVSPGSIVLFSGKLVMLLLVYIREDAAVVRQPIYGLFLGNLLIVVNGAASAPACAGAPVPGQVARPHLPRPDRLADGVGHHAALRRFDPHHPALRAHGGVARQPGDPAHPDQRGGGADLRPDRLLYGAALLCRCAIRTVLYGGWAAKMGAAGVYRGVGRALSALRRERAPDPAQAVRCLRGAHLSPALRGAAAAERIRRADRALRPRPLRQGSAAGAAPGGCGASR